MVPTEDEVETIAPGQRPQPEPELQPQLTPARMREVGNMAHSFNRKRHAIYIPLLH
jgi:hypothetical protein